MDWGARLRAAWSGEVSSADLQAMFAATDGLRGLQQQLADRQLGAQIEHAGHEWRAVLTTGRLAALLWLADALVRLAGALSDTDAKAHPEHPTNVDPRVHDLVANLLLPVEDLLADAAALLADPDHRTTPIMLPRDRPFVGPGGLIAGGALPDPIPLAYARGLQAGAQQLLTSAEAGVLADQALIAKSPAPDWLSAGFRRVAGELRAAETHLSVAEVRLTPLAAGQGHDPAGLRAICGDLWRIVNTAMGGGLQAADPHLLPEAQTASARADWSPSSVAPPAANAPSAPAPPRPARVPRYTPPLPLPDVPEGAPSQPERPESEWRPPEDDAVSPPNIETLPAIGPDADPTADAAPQTAALPAIGKEPAASEPHVGGPQHRDSVSPHAPPSAPLPAIGDDKEKPASDPIVRFPEIG